MSGGRVEGDGLHFDKCPRCGNEEFSEGARFCRRCAAPRTNECSNDSCNMAMPLDAAYCESCGGPTIHFILGLIEDWQGPYEEPTRVSVNTFDEEDVPF